MTILCNFFSHTFFEYCDFLLNMRNVQIKKHCPIIFPNFYDFFNFDFSVHMLSKSSTITILFFLWEYEVQKKADIICDIASALLIISFAHLGKLFQLPKPVSLSILIKG